jgi:protein-tyrosine phosphatase
MGPTPHDHAAEPFRLLFVCTANRCRSPMAEYLARQSLARRQIDAEVVSSGRLGGSFEASPGAVAALAKRGIDLRGHTSAPTDPDTLDHAHLVLVMERAHLADVYQTKPGAVSRSFTLGEFPTLLKAVAAQPADADAAPTQRAQHRIALAHDARDPARILVDDDSADIADPMGRWNLHYRRTAKQLEHLIEATLDGLFGKRSG